MTLLETHVNDEGKVCPICGDDHLHIHHERINAPEDQDCGIDRRTEHERIRDRKAAEAAAHRSNHTTRGLWLIAETTRGVFLEFWRDGAAVVSLEPRPALSIEELELLRAQFKSLNLIPRPVMTPLQRRMQSGGPFGGETQD
jgi:hypothetical protein